MEQPTTDTSNFLDWVEIKNFKSIKDLRLDCKRVNIFIGKPNVGKSNILEALGLLGDPNASEQDKLSEGSIRYDNLKDLFYDFDVSQKLEIRTPERAVSLETVDSTIPDKESFSLLYGKGNSYQITLSTSGITDGFQLKKVLNSRVKKYDFTNLLSFKNYRNEFLYPPHGNNLYAVIYKNKELWEEFAKLFEQQGLELVLSTGDQSIVLQKKIGHLAYQYQYFSIADTFRRFMFYITAIESNKSSILIFEEPEVHSFPPYTQELAYRMIYDEDNQYFISTHSPYMLHPFIEKMKYEDLNVFVTYYEDYETRVRAISYEEFRDILDYSTNVFFNLERFTRNAASQAAS